MAELTLSGDVCAGPLGVDWADGISRVVLGRTGVLALPKSGSAAEIPARSSYEIRTGDFTVEVWLRSWTGGPVLALIGAGAPVLLLAVKPDGSLEVGSRGVRVFGIAQGSNALDGNWHHLALTRREGEGTIYLDGVKQAVSAAAGSIDLTALTTLRFACTGHLSEVRFWGASRTQSELRASMYYRPANAAGLLGYWPLADRALRDHSSNPNTEGRLIDAGFETATIAHAPQPGELTLTGTASFVAIDAHPAYNVGLTDFTLEAWALTRTDGTIIARTARHHGGAGFRLACAGRGRLQFSIEDEHGNKAVVTQPPGTRSIAGAWHHVAAMRVSGTLRLFIDGSCVAQEAGAAIPVSLSSEPLVFGHHEALIAADEPAFQAQLDAGVPAPPPAALQPFSLKLAEVRFWRHARSDDQIYRTMHVQVHDDTPHLFGYWNFATGNVVGRAAHVTNLGVSAHEASVLPGGPALNDPQHVLHLDGGSHSYVTMPSSDALDAREDFTVEMRFCAAQPGRAGTLLSRARDGAGSCGVRVRVTATQVECVLDDGTSTTYAANADVLDGKWHHLAWVRKNKLMACFVDMRMRACTPEASAQALVSTRPLFVGAYHSPAGAFEEGFDGKLDFVYLFKKALPLADLQRNAYVALSGDDAPSAAWTFDRGAALDLGLRGVHGVPASASVRIEPDGDLPAGVPLSQLRCAANGHADCGERVDLGFAGAAAFSLAAWIAPASDSGSGTIFSRSDGAGGGYRLGLDGGIPVVQRGGHTVRGVSRLRAATWYFVCATFDGQQLAVSVNGVLEGSGQTNEQLGALLQARALIGTCGGDVQRVEVWSRALPAAEVRESMSTTPTGAEDGCKALWNFLYGTSQDWTANGPAAVLVDAGYRARAFAASAGSAIAMRGGAYIDCGSEHALNTRDALTIEAWVRVNAFDRPWQTIVAKGRAFQLRRYGTEARIAFSTAGVKDREGREDLLSVKADLLDGRWHHLAGTFDGHVKSLYVDGQLENHAEVSGDIDPDDRSVYVGDTATAANRLLALDPRTGKPQHEIGLAAQSRAAGTAVAAGRDVVVTRGYSGIAAVNTRLRKLLWQQPLSSVREWEIFPPVVHGNSAYVADPERGLLAFHLRTGTVRTVVPGEIATDVPVVDGGVLYYRQPSAVHAVDLRTGKPRKPWNLPVGMMSRGGLRLLEPGVLLLSYFASSGNRHDGYLQTLRTGGEEPVAGEAVKLPDSVHEVAVENGSIYARLGSSGKGAVRAFTYDAQNNSLIEKTWNLDPGPPQSWVYPVLAAEDPYIGLVGGSTLVAFKSADGAFFAREKAPYSQRSGLQIINGMLYSWSGDMLFTYDLPGADGGQLVPRWRFRADGSSPLPVTVKSAPLTIGAAIAPDGAVEAAFNGLVCEVRLWSRARTRDEIEATRTRRLIGNENELRGYWPCTNTSAKMTPDRSTHNNDGHVMAGAWIARADLQLDDPLPFVRAQARMMKHWSPASKSDRPIEQVVFRTEIHVFDGSQRPLAHGAVRVWTDEKADIVANGVGYAVDPGRAAQLTTDGSGVITVITPCNELTTPTLQIWIDTMPERERVIIHPDDNLNLTLSKLEGVDLRTPSRSSNPLLRSREPMLALDETQAKDLANAISSAVSNVKRPVDASTSGSSLELLDAPPPRNPRDNAASHRWYLRDREQYVQYPGAGDPAWQFTFKDRTFRRVSDADVAHMLVGVAAVDVIERGHPDFAGLWDAFWSKAREAVDVIVSGITCMVKLVVDGVTKLLKFAFETIKEVGQAIYGLLSQLVAQVAKIFEFFAFLFDWDDILNCKKRFVDQTKTSFGKAVEVVDDLQKKLDAYLREMETRFKQMTDDAVAELGHHTVDGYLGGCPQRHPWTPPAAANASMLLGQGASGPAVGVESNWFFSMLLENGSGITGGAQFAHDAAFDALGEKLQNVLDDFLGEQARSTFGKAYDYFASIGTHPEAIGQLLLQGLLETFFGIVEFGLELARKFAALVLAAIKAVIGQMLDYLAAPIEIPVISWLYKNVITKGDGLSMLDLGALVLAAPATVLYKAMTYVPPDGQPGGQSTLGGYTRDQYWCKNAHAWGVTITGFFGAMIGVASLAGSDLPENVFRVVKTVIGAVTWALNCSWIYAASPKATHVVAWFSQSIGLLSACDWLVALIRGVWALSDRKTIVQLPDSSFGEKGFKSAWKAAGNATGLIATLLNFFIGVPMLLIAFGNMLSERKILTPREWADYGCAMAPLVFTAPTDVAKSVVKIAYKSDPEPDTKAALEVAYAGLVTFQMLVAFVITGVQLGFTWDARYDQTAGVPA